MRKFYLFFCLLVALQISSQSKKMYFNSVEYGTGTSDSGINNHIENSTQTSNNDFNNLSLKYAAAVGLEKGDLAVIGMNGDVDFTGSTVRSFALVTLGEISANEVIKITDRGWINAYSSVSGHFIGAITTPQPAGSYTNEGILQWKPSQDIPAGTIVIIKINLADRMVSGIKGD